MTILVDPRELEFEYYKSPGPGGQNINKVSSAVRLRFNIRNSTSLTQDVKDRLPRFAGNRVTVNGELIIEAHRYRTREENQKDAIERLEALVARSAIPPKRRYRTRPSRSSVEKRIETKRRRSQIKRTRAGGE